MLFRSISKLPSIEVLLLWAERQGSAEVLPMHIEAACGANGWYIEGDLNVINGLVWGFLNSAVTDKARITFSNAGRMNGLDAWRRLCYRTDLGSENRIMELERQIDRPQSFKSIDAVLPGLEDWDNLLRRMREAGGELPSDRKLRYKLLEMLDRKSVV